MANLLQSSQVKTTEAPSYYTDYLSNLATAGRAAQGQAQFVGAQPLQQQAFADVAQNAGAYQPALTTGQGYVGKVATNDPAQMAQSYMNPYINTAVQSLSDISNRNIRQNLAPQSIAATVGSGQFGSQRGAQALGQVESAATQDLNNAIAQMLSTGYGQALSAAGQQQQTLNQAGLNMGALGTQQQQMSLADINAKANLGGQQQQIGQNQQMFPLTSMASLAQLLQGYAIPTGTTNTLQMSPFSALGALGSGALGMTQGQYVGQEPATIPDPNDPNKSIPNPKAGQPKYGSSPLEQIKQKFDKLFPSTPTTPPYVAPTTPPYVSPIDPSEPPPDVAPDAPPDVAPEAQGGLVQAGYGR